MSSISQNNPHDLQYTLTFFRNGDVSMSRLLVYLKDYKKECIFAPLFKMLEALFELFVPLVMAAVIDTGIANSDRFCNKTSPCPV